MKNSKAAPALLRTGLALFLACGLAVPAGAASAYGDEAQGGTTPPLETIDENGDSSALLSTISAAIQGAALYGTAPAEDAMPQAAGSPAEADAPAANPRAADYTAGGLTVSGGVKDTDFKDTGSAIEVLTGTPLTFTGTSTTYGIQISAGVKADITLNNVNIKKDRPFELLTGKNANAGTFCHITLARKSVNVLNANGTYSAGLRCGIGSTLVIDDDNLNIRAGGSKLNIDDIITPKNGRVGFDGETLSGVTVSASNDLSVLESDEPGSLKCAAGINCAAIGGSSTEQSGTMIFNGGTIMAVGSNSGAALTNDAYNWETYWTTEQGTDHGGAGIGGGNMASGSLTIFNGGNITAKASYHGSGIGGGYSNPDYYGKVSPTGSTHKAPSACKNSDAVSSTPTSANRAVAGDIVINGGYLKSYASGHGNAFGQGCAANNNGKTITVTGGTLLPWSNDGRFDIGGDGGYVVITGGSIKLTGAESGKPAPTNKFQSGESNSAYNAPPGDPDRQKIFMFCVDLSKSDGVGTEPVASWDLEIGGMPYTYGAPSYFDEGKLYLWLPVSAVGKEITVKLKRYDENGNLKPVEDLTAKPGDTSGAGLGKRWISYSLPEEFVEENRALFSKYYDGVSISNLITALESYTDETGLPAPYGANPSAVLQDSASLVYQSAKLDDNGKPLEEYYPATAVHDHGILPSNSGALSVRVQSNEFATPGSITADSFWGHETVVNVSIYPVNSKTEFIPYTLKGTDGTPDTALAGPTWMQDSDENPNKASVNHLIVPVDVTSFTYPDGDTVDGSNMTKPTCAAPYGQVQLFLDGEPISEAHGGVMTFTREDLEDPDNGKIAIVKDGDGREHTVALFDLSRSQLEAHGLKATENDEHTVAAKYTSRTDAEPAAAAARAARTAAAPADAGDAPSSVYRNYYDSETEETFVQIQRSDCKFDIYNEKDTAYDPGDETTSPVIDEAHAAQTVFYNIADFTDPNSNRFPLYIDTNSIGEVTFTSSNPAVLTISPSTVPNRADRFTDADDEDFGFGAWATVHAAGKTTITATIAATGAFKEATRTFDVYVYPDPAAEPVITDVETAYNLTRNDGSIRPYDTLRYTATFTNETPNSSFQNPVLTISVPADTTLKSLSVTDPEGTVRQLKAGQDYRAESVIGRAFRTLAARALGKPDLSPGAQVLTVDSLPALFGNQSYRLTMDVTVNPDVVAKTADAMDFYSQSTANGVYGIDPAHDEQYPWDTRIPGTGNAVEEAWDDADPTSVEPEDPDAPKPPSFEDIIGGGLVTPEDPDDPDDPNDPDDPDAPSSRPGVEVGTVVPGGPLDTAEKPDPDDPDDEGKRTPDPILPGDRIVSVGDTPDPKTPQDVQKEIDEQIKKKLEEDPGATEVEIPVVIERYDPDNPDDDPVREEVIITVPIPEGYDPDGPDPDDRDDHELVVIPADPKLEGDDEGPADIELSKTAENVTPGRGDRGNQGVALVGDTIRYTVTVSNTRPGTCWYDVVVRDLIPAGMAYVAGSAVVTDAQGVEHRDFADDFADGTEDVAFYVGDVPGGMSAIISFECTVTPALLDTERPVNIAHAAGTPPSETIRPVDPSDPGGPVKQDRDPQPPGPVDPSTPGVWPDDVVTPATPPAHIDDVVPADPERGKLTTTKSAENLTHEGGSVYVGDTIRYTVVFSNDDEPWTSWFDVVIQDKMPKGLVPIEGGIKLVDVSGNEISCPDSVYSAEKGDVTVFAGPVRGGQKVTLVIDAMVTEDALGTDIGNVAFAYGTDPSDTESDVLAGNPSGSTGSRFDAVDDLEQAATEGAGFRSESKVTYPENYDGQVRPAPDGDAADAATKVKTKRLAQTGDETPLGIALALAALAAAMLAVTAVAALHIRRAR